MTTLEIVWIASLAGGGFGLLTILAAKRETGNAAIAALLCGAFAAYTAVQIASEGVVGFFTNHGLFQNGELRQSILGELARRKGVSLPDSAQELGIEQEFDKLADWVRGSLDMNLIYQMTGLVHDFEQAQVSG